MLYDFGENFCYGNNNQSDRKDTLLENVLSTNKMLNDQREISTNNFFFFEIFSNRISNNIRQNFTPKFLLTYFRKGDKVSLST